VPRNGHYPGRHLDTTAMSSVAVALEGRWSVWTGLEQGVTEADLDGELAPVVGNPWEYARLSVSWCGRGPGNAVRPHDRPGLVRRGRTRRSAGGAARSGH